jgi:hypothetical protein
MFPQRQPCTIDTDLIKRVDPAMAQPLLNLGMRPWAEAFAAPLELELGFP